MFIHSPKTIEEYTNKFDKFFNFLNTLGETDFKTNDIETKYLLLYTKAKNNMNWFISILHKYIQYQKNRVNEEKLSCATFAKYFSVQQNSMNI